MAMTASEMRDANRTLNRARGGAAGRGVAAGIGASGGRSRRHLAMKATSPTPAQEWSRRRMEPVEGMDNGASGQNDAINSFLANILAGLGGNRPGFAAPDQDAEAEKDQLINWRRGKMNRPFAVGSAERAEAYTKPDEESGRGGRAMRIGSSGRAETERQPAAGAGGDTQPDQQEFAQQLATLIASMYRQQLGATQAITGQAPFRQFGQRG